MPNDKTYVCVKDSRRRAIIKTYHIDENRGVLYYCWSNVKKGRYFTFSETHCYIHPIRPPNISNDLGNLVQGIEKRKEGYKRDVAYGKSSLREESLDEPLSMCITLGNNSDTYSSKFSRRRLYETYQYCDYEFR